MIVCGHGEHRTATHRGAHTARPGDGDTARQPPEVGGDVVAYTGEAPGQIAAGPAAATGEHPGRS
ncbi:hypothetical protein AB0L34_05140 [Micromonospora sp. NPDC052213]|uniref:hypothetical protein n=1 Tax=Micromonospora sp. NPDC052213 TaxID=3155812 RepID=UPI003437C593